MGQKIIFHRTDGEKATSDAAEKIIGSLGIVRLSSSPETPAQNGAAKICGKVIVQAARSPRVEANLPKNLWPWMCTTAAYLLNRTPTKKIAYRTPFEKVTGKLPFLGHLHKIGSKAFVLNKHVPKKDKMEAKAQIGYLVGFEGTKIFQVWVPHLKGQKKKIIRTREVVFKDEVYKPLQDITQGQVLSEGQHNLVIQKFEIPEDEIREDHNSPYITAAIPL